jgi:hypothetical protein
MEVTTRFLLTKKFPGTSIFNVILGTNDFTDICRDTAHTWSDIVTDTRVPTDVAAIFTTFS